MLSKKNVYVLTLFLNYKQSIDALTVTKQKSRVDDTYLFQSYSRKVAETINKYPCIRISITWICYFYWLTL